MNARLDLNAIRRDNPLPDIAARLVPLKTVGKEWMGCCPFHADRSPSFTIFDCGRRFYCFGCAASGDVLDFVQRAYRVTLPEAARMLGAGDVPKLEGSSRWPIAEAAQGQDNSKAALAIWNRAQPAAQTLGEVSHGSALRKQSLPALPPTRAAHHAPASGFAPAARQL